MKNLQQAVRSSASVATVSPVPTPAPPNPETRAESRAQSRANVDLDLFARIQRGDRSALGDLYDRHASLLLALTTRVLGDRGDGEEALQEVFLLVWQHPERYDSQRSSVLTWLSLLARSRALDRLRRKNSRRRTVDAVEREVRVVQEAPRGVARTLDGERRRRVQAALRDLSHEQREVVQLAYYQGLTQREIAERTATPLGTVKTRTLAAFTRLRRQLRSDIRELL